MRKSIWNLLFWTALAIAVVGCGEEIEYTHGKKKTWGRGKAGGRFLISVYEGQLKDGVPHGRGKEYLATANTTYVGEFKDGEYHGEGTLYNEKKEVLYQGEWEDGWRAGEKSIWHSLLFWLMMLAGLGGGAYWIWKKIQDFDQPPSLPSGIDDTPPLPKDES